MVLLLDVGLHLNSKFARYAASASTYFIYILNNDLSIDSYKSYKSQVELLGNQRS